MNTFKLTSWLLLSALISAEANGQSALPHFRTHVLSTTSTYPSCAVFDVDRDGKRDIFCGGWWYQAPDWQPRRVRDVQEIRGRFDDYSNLPLDVDQDGWIDVVSCNYRSESLYWVRNPGGQLDTDWEKIVIEAPGPMETGRLVDVDGDGTLDVLPNGTQFAAWWQCRVADGRVEWLRHDLPTALAGHGIGAGDVDGDGRMDLISANGWWQATDDGRWEARQEFRLSPDASIPIVVQDVDRDGDADLIWGRGHHFGLYWLEQTMSEDGKRAWTRHAIDTSWSQAHSLLMADLDGDGHDELLAGKRHMGHEGKDVGEYDAPMVCAYRFQPAQRSWQRLVISQDPNIGFGVDPKVADLDGDGDLDIVGGDRNGLCWCENLGTQATAPAESTAQPKLSAVNHQTLMQYVDEQGQRQQISDPVTWSQRRAVILEDMQRAMGEMPGPQRRVPLDVEIVEQRDFPTYLMQRIRFTPEPDDRVPAWLLLPKNSPDNSPAMLCLHQTTAIGKDEPAGLGGSANLHYAQELAERGFICLVPDYPSFGEYAFDFKAWNDRYGSGSMKAIWNNIRAIDLLESLPQVDENRIGCIGHSLGGHNALFTAAFDQRIAAVVTSCGFNAFHHYYEGKLAGWTSDRYMPRIDERYHNDPDQVPFDFYEVLAAIAPRAIFVNAPLGDANFEVTGVRKVQATLPPVYQLFDRSDATRFEYPDCEHDFPPEIRHAAYQWLQEKLR